MNITDMILTKIKVILIGSILFSLFHCQNQKEMNFVLAKELNVDPDIPELKIYKKEYQLFKELSSKGINFTNAFTDSNPYCVRFRNGRAYEMEIKGNISKYLGYLSKFKSLEKITFQGTDIKSLKELPEMTNLKDLRFIYCKKLDNQLVLPFNLKNITSLMVWSCGIKQIKFPTDNELESLMLFSNEIERLNKSFLHLKNLKILVLSGNKITKLDLSELPHLKQLTLTNNPIKNIEEIKEQHSNVKVIF